MRVAALTQGLNIPSSRFRVRQLIKPMVEHGIIIDEYYSKHGSYPPDGRLNRIRWLIETGIDSCQRVAASHRYDACIVQRELISTLPSFEGGVRKPMIVDIDDAIWMYRRGWAASNLSRHASHIVVGNSFLADYFSKKNREISIIPTGVDISRFIPKRDRQKGIENKIIGWSGTWGGYAYFEPLQNALASLLRKHSDWKIRFISDRPPLFDLLPKDQIEYIPWNSNDEARHIAEFDIGLMPLDHSEWSLGKCSYKMLLYMACAVPVIATDIGMNQEILHMGKVGFGVRAIHEWQESLEELMANSSLRHKMGNNGLELVHQRFSLEVVAAQWENVLGRFK